METKHTWLLIEDDVDDQDFFKMALTSITDRVNCVVAKNGLEALKIIQGDQNFIPSCIFIDLNMPLMNGFDFLQNVKKFERLAEVPRVVYTTSNATFDREMTLKLGARFVTKFTSFAELRNFLLDCVSLYADVSLLTNNRASQFSKTNVPENLESTFKGNVERSPDSLKGQSVYSNSAADVYEQLLNSAMEVMQSDLASIQLYSQTSEQLKLMATRNFHPTSIDFWHTVSAASGSVCGEALRKRTRITISDIETVAFVKDEIEIFRVSGIRAVQSTPLVSPQGKIIGMISTHWKEEHQFSQEDFKYFDAFAQMAADIISQKTSCIGES